MDAEMRKVLQDARRLLIEDGWIQGGGTGIAMDPDRHGPLCISLAVSRAKRSYSNGVELETLGFSSVTEAFGWNDAPERTFDDVIALFDSVLAADPELAETPEPVLA
jgi:hypothetical protein